MIKDDPQPRIEELAYTMKTQALLILGAVVSACASTSSVQNEGVTPPPAFEAFTPSRSAYKIVPGDQLEISFLAAPELSRTVTVGPDGRVQLPMIQPVMIAGLSTPQAQSAVQQAMAQALVDPTIDMLVTTFAPQQVFVGGEVGQPGVFELPGQIDPLQAIIMAGGFTDSSNMRQVILVRRDASGQTQSYAFNVRDGIYNPQLARFGALQRFDVIYVPKSPIAQHNLFIQQYIRDALPVNFSLFYDVAGGNR